MEVTKSCLSCGKFDILVDKIDLGDDEHHTENWFVKCLNCPGVTTITHVVRDEAIRQWENQWAWAQIEALMKRVKEAEGRESFRLLRQAESERILQYRYEKITDEYVKYRMLYSGTAGNLSLEDRRNMMKKELSSELGWTI